MENLDLYEKLQPLFRKKMGPIQIGDRIFDVRDNMSGFVIAVDGNRLDYITGDGSVYWTKLVDAIRLPLPIDPVNPERGLAGMIRGGWELLKSPGMDGCFITISPMSIPEYSAEERNNVLEGKSPTEALLRALLAQEGL